MKSLKIAFGVITRSLSKDYPYINFLKNAQLYGYQISSIVFGYKDFVSEKITQEIKQFCDVCTIHLGETEYLTSQLSRFDLSEKEISALIGTPQLEKYSMVSYGTARNYVLLTALFKGADILLFFDTDVYPQILFEDNDCQFHYEEVDFVGSHLKILNEHPKVVATTSDYTGYFIIPKMKFPHLEDLLFGLQKENNYTYISKENKLTLKHGHSHNIHPTQKVLGGNLALDLRKIKYLSPFFSETLIKNNECFLGRGEDTLFGPLINHYGGTCFDIDLPIFHNCFGDFPNEPDIGKKNNLDRFFYACMGWIIRNPFYNWLHGEYICDMPPINTDKRYQSLFLGSKAAADYFHDNRFLMLPSTFQESYEQLENTKSKFYDMLSAWNKLQTKM